MQHVRSGPQFFRDNMDLTQVRPLIAALKPDEKLAPIDRRNLKLRLPRRSERESLPRRLARSLTLQGFLLPRGLLRDRVLLHEKDFFGRARDVWRYRRVLYRHGPTETGYIVELDRGRFFSELRDMLRELRLLLKQQPALRQAYAEAMQQMGSAAFWREVYGLPEGAAAASVARPAAGEEARDVATPPVQAATPVTPSV